MHIHTLQDTAPGDFILGTGIKNPPGVLEAQYRAEEEIPLPGTCAIGTR